MDHFSEDAMELLQLPSFEGSSQPAETFYLRKYSATPLGLFDEVKGTGVTYLFSQLHGKTNSNHVTSVLDHGIKEKKKTGVNNRKLRVNLDNCSVNKCYMLIRYGIELIRLKIYDSVEFCFMVAGHTKFSPDRMFGWLSGVLKVVDIFELSDVATAVDAARLQYLRAHKREAPYSVKIVDSFNSEGLSTFFYDWKSYFMGSYTPFGFLNELHCLKVSLSSSGIELKAKEKTSDSSWKPIKFLNNSKVGKRKLKNLPMVPLKPAKVADLLKMAKFIPGGKLSYASP